MGAGARITKMIFAFVYIKGWGCCLFDRERDQDDLVQALNSPPLQDGSFQSPRLKVKIFQNGSQGERQEQSQKLPTYYHLAQIESQFSLSIYIGPTLSSIS
jgi:hypothetical protein